MEGGGGKGEFYALFFLKVTIISIKKSHHYKKLMKLRRMSFLQLL